MTRVFELTPETTPRSGTIQLTEALLHLCEDERDFNVVLSSILNVLACYMARQLDPKGQKKFIRGLANLPTPVQHWEEAIAQAELEHARKNETTE
jgi:hypothetical protein